MNLKNLFFQGKFKKDCVNVVAFKNTVFDRHIEIDPSGEHNWESIALGWSLSRGASPENAKRFAEYIRYSTPYWKC